MSSQSLSLQGLGFGLFGRGFDHTRTLPTCTAKTLFWAGLPLKMRRA
uniref:Uncharacterized protein n=1 Tax=uncultured alpha proteobacterium HF0010_30A23 TaxID=710802 RepID=E0XRM7_9PROT|nr:hypothetical protein [uncultured alpha proteobacterium HF0010_30A23]